MVSLLNKMRITSNYKFDMQVFTLDQSQPGWSDADMRRHWLEERHIPMRSLPKILQYC